MNMTREIILYHTESDKCPVEEFFESLTEPQFEKVAFVLDLIEQMPLVPKTYFKKLEGTDLWEVRVQYGGNIFRLLGFFDAADLVLVHAFAKKSQKLQQRDLTLAKQRQQDYFQRKG